MILLLAVLLPFAQADPVDPAEQEGSAGSGPCHFYTLGDPAWKVSPSSDGPPAWSPDGTEILFQSTRDEGFAQIFAIRPDGSGLRRLTDGTFRAGQPHWGPDGRVTFVSDRDGEREIYSMAPDGGDVRRLTEDGTPKSFPVSSPDGGLVSFVRSIDESSWRRDLCLLDRSTGEQHLLHRSRGGLGWTSWSPDGRFVYFYEILVDGTNQLFRVAIDELRVEQLTRDPAFDVWCPDPSPDGELLAYLRSERVDGDWGANGDLVVARADLTGARVVSGGPWHENSVRFAPDGESLAYMSMETGYYELHVIGADGSGDRRLTFQPASELTAIVRRAGFGAGVAHCRALEGEGPLASDHALWKLFEGSTARLADAESEPADRAALARIYLEWYPDSPHARRVAAPATRKQ